MVLQNSTFIVVSLLFLCIELHAEPSRRYTSQDLWDTTTEKASDLASAVGNWYVSGYRSFWRDAKRDAAHIGKKLQSMNIKRKVARFDGPQTGEKADAVAALNRNSILKEFKEPNILAFMIAVRRDCSPKDSEDMFLLVEVFSTFRSMLDQLDEMDAHNEPFGREKMRDDLKILSEKILAFIHLQIRTLPENERITSSSLAAVATAILAEVHPRGIDTRRGQSLLTASDLRELAPVASSHIQNRFGYALHTLHAAARTEKRAYCEVNLDRENEKRPVGLIEPTSDLDWRRGEVT